jgi:hypothetical protein
MQTTFENIEIHRRPNNEQIKRIFSIFEELHNGQIAIIDYEKGIITLREGKFVNNYFFCVQNDTLQYNKKSYRLQ